MDTDNDTLGPCGCTDYHMSDCPTRTLPGLLGEPEPWHFTGCPTFITLDASDCSC